MLHGRLFSGEFGPVKKVFPYRHVDCVLHVFPTGWEGNQSTVGVFNSLAERKYFIYISQGFLGFLATEVFFVWGGVLIQLLQSSQESKDSVVPTCFGDCSF